MVYKARDDVGGIIHIHSPSATAFPLANRELPCRAEPLLRFGQAEAVPVAWGPRGSDVSVRGIASALDEHPITSAALLANHGLLALGTDPMAAARLVVAVEVSAEAESHRPGLRRGPWTSLGGLEAVPASMARARA